MYTCQLLFLFKLVVNCEGKHVWIFSYIPLLLILLLLCKSSVSLSTCHHPKCHTTWCYHSRLGHETHSDLQSLLLLPPLYQLFQGQTKSKLLPALTLFQWLAGAKSSCHGLRFFNPGHVAVTHLRMCVPGWTHMCVPSSAMPHYIIIPDLATASSIIPNPKSHPFGKQYTWFLRLAVLKYGTLPRDFSKKIAVLKDGR